MVKDLFDRTCIGGCTSLLTYLYAHNNCVCKIALWKNQYSCKRKYSQSQIQESVSLCSKGTEKKLTQNKNSIRIGDDILTYDREECCKV